MKARVVVTFDIDDEYYSYPQTSKEEVETACNIETTIHSILQSEGDGKGIVTDTLNVSAEILHPAEQPIDPYY